MELLLGNRSPRRHRFGIKTETAHRGRRFEVDLVRFKREFAQMENGTASKEAVATYINRDSHGLVPVNTTGFQGTHTLRL